MECSSTHRLHFFPGAHMIMAAPLVLFTCLRAVLASTLAFRSHCMAERSVDMSSDARTHYLEGSAGAH